MLISSYKILKFCCFHLTKYVSYKNNNKCQLKKQAPKIFRKNITYELLKNTCIRNVLEI